MVNCGPIIMFGGQPRVIASSRQYGRVTAATVDHVVPRKGDWTAFCTSELQSLCEPCHTSTKRQSELRSYRTDIGLEGSPSAPHDPFNRAR